MAHVAPLALTRTDPEGRLLCHAGVIACSQDNTRLSCVVRVGSVNTTADKTRQF